MGDQIKRYQPEDLFVGMEPIEDGGWVEYEDHAEAVEALQQRITELEASLADARIQPGYIVRNRLKAQDQRVRELECALEDALEALHQSEVPSRWLPVVEALRTVLAPTHPAEKEKS